MRDQQIVPGLTTVAHSVIRGVMTPLHSNIFLGLYVNIIHVIAGLGFEHIDAVRRLRYEVRVRVHRGSLGSLRVHFILDLDLCFT